MREETRAWLIVAICAVMVAMGFGAIVNIAVFLTPLALEFGWPRADLSLAYSVATISTGLGGIMMGHFADRMPIRRIALCGALVPGVALIGLAHIQSTTELYLYHALMGLLGVGAVMAPLNNLAGLWLTRNPGLAIGIVSAGGAAGQGLAPFFARYLVQIDGWREAYFYLGVIYLAVMLPLALLIRDAPRAAVASAANQNTRTYPVSRSTLLALLSLAVIFCCICMSTPIVHVAALGTDLGFGGQESAGLLAVMMIFGMAGRVAFGRLSDRIGNLPSYAVASLGQTALAFIFPYLTTRAELYVLSALFGIAFSGAMTGFTLCAREFSPPGRTGFSIGLILFFGWVGMAAGAWQGGLFYDWCGNYVPSFQNASLGGLVNLLILALLWRFTMVGPHRPSLLRTNTAA